MTRSKDRVHIDVSATLEQGIREFHRSQRERILRELRYVPGFSGSMTFTLKFREGVPFATEEQATHNRLLPPVMV